MSSSAKQPLKIIAVLKLPEYEVPLLIIQATSIVTRMAASPWFPSPRPKLAALLAAIDDLSAAQAETLTRRKDSYPVRDAKRETLVRLLGYLRDYVQAIADQNYESAVEIIESAGMHVKRGRASVARGFQARRGRLEDEVILSWPSAGDRAAYEVELSFDGGATWLAVEPKVITKTTRTVTGLKPGVSVHFRYRATVKSVPGDWSDPIAIIVG
jgi:hypothetical protein